MDETYERILASQKSDEERTLLKRVFHLVIYGQRAMTVPEVAEAAIIEEGVTALDPDERFTNPYDLLRECGSLFIVTGGLLGLAHYSVQEYLKSDRISQGHAKFFEINDADANLQLTLLCTTYLGFDDFRDGPCQSAVGLERRLLEYPFLDYAANHWFFHAKGHYQQRASSYLVRRFWSAQDQPNYLSWKQIFTDKTITLQRCITLVCGVLMCFVRN